MKFNEYYNMFNYFVLKDNKLYYLDFKIGQPEK